MGLILLGLPLLNFLANSNTESTGNTNLLITLPVLAAGVLYVIASFIEKRDDTSQEK
jgi:cyanate permease